MAIDKDSLIAIATTHPVLSVRRSAAHMLYSLGAFSSAMATSSAIARERSQELAAKQEVAAALAKAQGGAK